MVLITVIHIPRQELLQQSDTEMHIKIHIHICQSQQNKQKLHWIGCDESTIGNVSYSRKCWLTGYRHKIPELGNWKDN